MTLVHASSRLTAATVVAPSGYANIEGGDSRTQPFGEFGNHRMQQIISASEFSSVGPMLISGFALREAGGGFGFMHSMSNEVRISTTSAQVDSLSPIFAQNVGLDETVVLPRSQEQLITGFYDSFFSPQEFMTFFYFTRPFLYNPQSGNLLLEIRRYAGNYADLPHGVAPFDSVRVSGDGVSRLVGTDAESLTGVADTSGYIIQFQYTAVPEPSSIALLAAGAAIFGWCAVKRRR